MKKDFCTAVSLLLISLFCFSMCSKGDDLIIDPPPTEGETEDEDSIYTWESERQAILESTDMVLIYGGGHHRDPYEWNQERISPYVTYVDESGEEHWFFDSFLFLEIMDSGMVYVVLVLKKTGYRITPYFTYLHADIIRRRCPAVLYVCFHISKGTGIIGISGNSGLAVPYHRFHTVAERLATESELVPP